MGPPPQHLLLFLRRDNFIVVMFSKEIGGGIFMRYLLKCFGA